VANIIEDTEGIFLIGIFGAVAIALYYLYQWLQNNGPGGGSPSGSNPIASLAGDLGIGTANIPLGGGPEGSTVASPVATAVLSTWNCLTSFGSNCTAADTDSGGDDGEATQ
jgi:hypothetical protein